MENNVKKENKAGKVLSYVSGSLSILFYLLIIAFYVNIIITDFKFDLDSISQEFGWMLIISLAITAILLLISYVLSIVSLYFYYEDKAENVVMTTTRTIFHIINWICIILPIVLSNIFTTIIEIFG